MSSRAFFNFFNDICKSNMRKLNLNGYMILIGLTRKQM